ncbi:MAG: TolC family protein [Phycisphaeraceae bacterium]|nr:TolC family protein [Phycisphaeraceae bacterium]
MRPMRGGSVRALVLLILLAGVHTACESRRLFDPDTLYTSPDPAQPWRPSSALAGAGDSTREPGWLRRRTGTEFVAAPSAIAAPRQAQRSDDSEGNETGRGAGEHGATLAELVDYALANNPATRAAWERARGAEARMGMVESRYFPQLNAVGIGGQLQNSSASTEGQEIIRGPIVGGALELTWVLLDFGRRDAASAAAAHALVSANFEFNRTIQTIVYKVQKAYFDLDAKLALEETARQNLETAVTQSEAVEERLKVGLATLPDHLQSKQRVSRARFDLEAARSDSISARAVLAREIGLPAEAWITIEPLRDLPIPAGLDVGVDQLVEESMFTRPDVRAKLARVRQADARVREAEAAFAPTISFAGMVGGAYRDYSVSTQPGAPFPPLDRRYTAGLPDYFLGLRASWLLFDGFERDFALRLANAERRAATAELESLRLEISSEVWASYFELRAARVQLQFGEALLTASQEAYDSVFQSYVQGLRTVTDLLQAESDLFTARSTLVRARADLLAAGVRLSYALGDDPRTPR